MSQINNIRDLSRKGYGISKISSLTGKDRKTVRKYLEQNLMVSGTNVEESEVHWIQVFSNTDCNLALWSPSPVLCQHRKAHIAIENNIRPASSVSTFKRLYCLFIVSSVSVFKVR